MHRKQNTRRQRPRLIFLKWRRIEKVTF